MVFWGCGSRSSDFDNVAVGGVENPLADCPESPNCVRLTISVDDSIGKAYDRAVNVITGMKPYEINLDPDSYRIEAVFVVVLYSDDMVIQLTPDKPDTTYLHIRSASRKGYTDLGVNRRRVKTFLSHL